MIFFGSFHFFRHQSLEDSGLGLRVGVITTLPTLEARIVGAKHGEKLWGREKELT